MIEELHEVYRHMMSILETYKDKRYTAYIRRGFSPGMGCEQIYEEFLKVYETNEYTVISENGWDKIVEPKDRDKGWQFMIRENHWRFCYYGSTLGSGMNKAYVRQELDYYPHNHENIMEWSWEEFDCFTYSDKYKVQITRNGEYIEEFVSK